MVYLAELEIKIPIDWHLNLQISIFEKFSNKKMMTFFAKKHDAPPTKNAKMGQKINFPFCDMGLGC